MLILFIFVQLIDYLILLSTGIGDLLIKHSLAITFLLRNMFGTNRIRQLEVRQKCARLVALAVMSSERKAQQESSTCSPISDEDDLCQVSATAYRFQF